MEPNKKICCLWNTTLQTCFIYWQAYNTIAHDRTEKETKVLALKWCPNISFFFPIFNQNPIILYTHSSNPQLCSCHPFMDHNNSCASVSQSQLRYGIDKRFHCFCFSEIENSQIIILHKKINPLEYKTSTSNLSSRLKLKIATKFKCLLENVYVTDHCANFVSKYGSVIDWEWCHADFIFKCLKRALLWGTHNGSMISHVRDWSVQLHFRDCNL
jgi:hypothetical protein